MTGACELVDPVHKARVVLACGAKIYERLLIIANSLTTCIQRLKRAEARMPPSLQTDCRTTKVNWVAVNSTG
jgi:hypothetical protein